MPINPAAHRPSRPPLSPRIRQRTCPFNPARPAQCVSTGLRLTPQQSALSLRSLSVGFGKRNAESKKQISCQSERSNFRATNIVPLDWHAFCCHASIMPAGLTTEMSRSGTFFLIPESEQVGGLARIVPLGCGVDGTKKSAQGFYTLDAIGKEDTMSKFPTLARSPWTVYVLAT